MRSKMDTNVWWIISLSVILSAMLISGCARSKQTVAPTGEEKKETSESVSAPKTEKEAATVPSSLSSPAKPSVPAESKSTQTAEKAPPQASQSPQDPIASGSVLLNPAVPSDAQLIQIRLSELGLYKAAIDGIWGKGSRDALKAFKGKNSLPNPDRWDKETQMLLFRGTAQKVSQPGGSSQNAIATGAILLNPAVHQDAQMIQTRLAEVGLYKAAIDGIWGKGSEAALRAFKEENSLPNPDKWDKETQMLLFR